VASSNTTRTLHPTISAFDLTVQRFRPTNQQRHRLVFPGEFSTRAADHSSREEPGLLDLAGSVVEDDAHAAAR